MLAIADGKIMKNLLNLSGRLRHVKALLIPNACDAPDNFIPSIRLLILFSFERGKVTERGMKEAERWIFHIRS